MHDCCLWDNISALCLRCERSKRVKLCCQCADFLIVREAELHYPRLKYAGCVTVHGMWDMRLGVESYGACTAALVRGSIPLTTKVQSCMTRNRLLVLPSMKVRMTCIEDHLHDWRFHRVVMESGLGWIRRGFLRSARGSSIILRIRGSSIQNRNIL